MVVSKSKNRASIFNNINCPKCKYSFLKKFFGPSMGYGRIESKWECPVCGKILEFDAYSKIIYWIIVAFTLNFTIIISRRLVDTNFFSVLGMILITFFLAEVIS